MFIPYILYLKIHTKELTMLCSTTVPSPNNGGSSVVDIIPQAVASYENRSRVPRLVKLNAVSHG